MPLPTRWVIAVVVASVLVSKETRAGIQSTVPAEVDPVNGGFRTSVPFELPAFHGLEPALGLEYSSSRRDSFVGYGWELRGASRVVAHHPKGGLPKYDGTDDYSLDGNLLRPVGSGWRGMGTGGTHIGEHHRFQRIVRNDAADTWTVTEKDGTVREYTRTVWTARGTYAWDLTKVRDTNGNEVTYTYAQGAGDSGTAYLDTIRYGDVVVTFTREARPDPVSFQWGSSVIGQSRHRLSHVSVKVGDALRNVWKLGYGLTATSNHSRLDSVQTCGRDAVVGASGAVTGTCAPATTFTYEGGGAVAFSARESRHNDSYAGFGVPMVGDVDGDGRSDLVWTKMTSTGFVARAMRSDGAALTLPGSTFSIAGDFTGWTSAVADVNGDGRSDIVLSSFGASGWNVRTAIADGQGGFVQGTAYLPMPACAGCGTDFTGYKLAVGDYNRDGAVDIVAWSGTATDGRTVRALAVSGGSGAFGPPALLFSEAGDFADRKLLLGDYRARGGVDGSHWTWTTPESDTFFSTDITGDGADDRVRVLDTGGVPTSVSWSSQVGYDTSLAQVWQTFSSPLSGMFDARSGGIGFADFDGDGRADLFAAQVASTSTTFSSYSTLKVGVALSRGGSFASAVVGYNGNLPGSGYGPLLVGDFDGDGQSDLVTSANLGTSVVSRLLLSTGASVGRLVSVKNPAGGTTTVTYGSSSSYSNDYLPVGFSLPVVKSIVVATGPFATTRLFTYEGGRWDDEERAFLGFAKVNRTEEDGTTTETLFRQTRASAGAPELITITNMEGKIYRQTRRTFLERNDNWPYYSLPAREMISTCNLATTVALPSTCTVAETATEWNTTYGVPTRFDDFGDLAETDDDATTTTSYAVNAEAFIGDRPSVVQTFEGIGLAGRQLAMTTYFYDNATQSTAPPTAGNLTKKQVWHDGAGYPFVETAQTFDEHGSVIRETDGLGRTATTAFDPSGTFPVRRCNALGHCTRQTWDAVVGSPLTTTDPNGKVTRFTYDALGRPVRTTYPSGGWVEKAYVAMGDPTAQHTRTTESDGSADGLWTRAFTDGLGRVYREEKEGGSRRHTVFYRDDPSRRWTRNPWLMSNTFAWPEITVYDGLGRITRVVHLDGTVVNTVYGANGTVTTTDERGHVTVRRLDARGRVRQVRELGDASRTTTFAYDALGRVTSMTDPANHRTTTSYDSLGRRTSSCDPDRGCIGYEYDEASNLIVQTDQKGQAVITTYDALNRPVTKTGGFRWEYDAEGQRGRMTKHVFPTGSDEYSYDFAGRVVSKRMMRSGQVQTVGTTYDTTGIGRPIATVFGDETITQTYDSKGAVSAISGYASAITRDPEGRVTSMTLANGVVDAATYDSMGRLATQRVSKGATTLFSATYGRDARGSVTSLSTSTNGVASNLTMTYDALDRLTAVAGTQAQTIAYDPLGNIVDNSLVGTYVYGAPDHVHAVTRAGGVKYRYDANGNMVSAGPRSFSWDEHNRLTSVTSAAGTSTYAYDGNGKRVVSERPGTTTLYFDERLEVENGVLSKYVFAGGRRIARRTGTTTVFFHQDGLDSTRLLTSSTGSVLRTYDYRPFGEVRSTTGSGATTSLRYGGYRSDDTGLQYLASRYYDPVLGRFLSADTIIPRGTPQHLNRYSYADNNPFTLVDPNGHSASMLDRLREALESSGSRGEYTGDRQLANDRSRSGEHDRAMNDLIASRVASRLERSGWTKVSTSAKYTETWATQALGPIVPAQYAPNPADADGTYKSIDDYLDAINRAGNITQDKTYGFVTKEAQGTRMLDRFIGHDVNGDGHLELEEFRPTPLDDPGRTNHFSVIELPLAF